MIYFSCEVMDESDSGYGLIKLERYRAQSDKKKTYRKSFNFFLCVCGYYEIFSKKKKKERDLQ